MFKAEVYVERRNKLRKLLSSGIIVLLGNNESPMNYKSNTYKFRQDSNFLYFFGLDHSGYAGIIDIEEGTDCLYGNDVGIEDIIWMGAQPSMVDQAASIGIKSVHPFKEIFSKVTASIRRGRKVHFLPPYRADNVLLLETLLGVRNEQLGNYVSKDLIKAVVSLRSIKEMCEIDEIEHACEIGYNMHITAMKMCHPGVMEHEIAGYIEGIALGNNGQVSFPIILSQNAQILHNHDHSQKLTKGRLMLTDAGAETYSHYASDFTRTIPVGGKFSQQQKDIYNIVLAANNRAIELAKPDITYQSVHLEAAHVIAKGLIDLGIMKGDAEAAVKSGAHALFFPHGLGHMMGLDVHDMEDLGENFVGYDDEVQRSTQFGTAALRLGRKLKPGFVVTVEPGIYFIPALIEKWKTEKINHSFINFDKVNEYINFGGIRLEDDILITDTGCRILGKKRIPITVDEVETTMNGQ